MTTRYNVLWITCDEMQARAASIYGNNFVKMPAAERLAREGVVFEQAHVQMPKCIPVRPMMMTGRYAHVDGLRTMSSRDFNGDGFMLLRPEDPSLLRWLKEDGYAVESAGVNHVMHHEESKAFFVNTPSKRKTVPPTFEEPSEVAQRAYFAGRVSEDYDWESFPDTVATENMIDFIEAHRDVPFFGVLDIREPHPVYKEWPGLLDDLSLADIPLPPRPDLDDCAEPIRAWRESHDIENLTDDERRRILRAYWSQCIFADALLGRVLDALDRLELTEKTLVIWSADHADFAGMYGCYEKWDTALYDCITHVPLAMRLPGVLPEGRRVENLVEIVDVAPTVMEILGHDIPPTVQGRSLLALAKGETTEHKDAVFAQGGVEPDATRRPGMDYEKKIPKPYFGKQRTLIEHPQALQRAVMVRTETHKLIYRLNKSHELYDLTKDPDELVNLYGEVKYAHVQHDLERHLLQFFIEYQADLPVITELWA